MWSKIQCPSQIRSEELQVTRWFQVYQWWVYAIGVCLCKRGKSCVSWCVCVCVCVCVHEYLSVRVCVYHDVCGGDSVCLCSFVWTSSCVFMRVVVFFELTIIIGYAYNLSIISLLTFSLTHAISIYWCRSGSNMCEYIRRSTSFTRSHSLTTHSLTHISI